ncbi:MAG: hypothetical protein Q4F72_11970, partial [Desulfovibrionaceae bacterium]|nr:hypothetical protein [Desulfovibrionaceae bacterium]
ERQALEEKKKLEAKMKRLKDQYGSSVPKQQQEEILLKSSELLGTLEGNKKGLQDRGQTSSSEADAAVEELLELQKGCGLKK